MAKQQFKAQADICKKSLDVLHKAIELDPDNTEEYNAGIAYTENVMKASNAIVKAFDVVEPPIPVVEEAEEVIAPVPEEDADLFAMFGD